MTGKRVSVRGERLVKWRTTVQKNRFGVGCGHLEANSRKVLDRGQHVQAVREASPVSYAPARRNRAKRDAPQISSVSTPLSTTSIAIHTNAAPGPADLYAIGTI